jgi:hypothetical protein
MATPQVKALPIAGYCATYPNYPTPPDIQMMHLSKASALDEVKRLAGGARHPQGIMIHKCWWSRDSDGRLSWVPRK